MVPFCIQYCTIQLKANYFVAVCSFCCYLAYSSLGKNLVSYLTEVLHETNVAAARDVGTWKGTSYFAPLAGAFVADTYLGKYRTALISCTIFIIVRATNHSCPFMI
jgi:peptide/histidine transporter 3/4